MNNEFLANIAIQAFVDKFDDSEESDRNFIVGFDSSFDEFNWYWAKHDYCGIVKMSDSCAALLCEKLNDELVRGFPYAHYKALARAD